MEKTADMRRELKCTVHPLGELGRYKYVVICSHYQGGWLLSRHRARDTWETQGGHIEAGETPIAAARRELYEESGVKDAEVIPVCDYHGYDSRGFADGVVFLAKIHALGPLPESEMKEVRRFETLPENLTYPAVTPALIFQAQKLLDGGENP